MPVDATGSSTSTTATPPADRISSRSAAMGAVDFLQMLTAQLKAQDPMNPLDSQDFASQLATFSSVQELQGMSETMDQSLQASLMLSQTFSNTMASTLIGKNVRAEVSEMNVGTAGDTRLSYNLPEAATDLEIEIKDSEGNVVNTLKVSAQSAGDHQLAWDGLDTEGRRVPAGTYTYSVTATNTDGKSINATTFVEGRVSEIRYSDGAAVLMVNGMEIMLGQVVSITEAEAAKKG